MTNSTKSGTAESEGNFVVSQSSDLNPHGAVSSFIGWTPEMMTAHYETVNSSGVIGNPSNYDAAQIVRVIPTDTAE